jgi:hypothetical protein
VQPSTGIQLGSISSIIQWQKGKQIVVYPANVADGKPIVPLPPWTGR